VTVAELTGVAALILAALTGTGGLTWYVTERRKARTEKAKSAAAAKSSEAAAVQAQLEGNLELSKYIREQVDAAVAKALEPVQRDLAEQKQVAERLAAREQATKTIVRRFFQRLLFWDQNGRQGPMPMPSEEDMQILDLSDLELHQTITNKEPS